MSSPFSPSRARVNRIAATIAAICLAALAGAANPPAGLQNPGFETGAIGAAPTAWTVAATDVAITVGAEGPSRFPVYQDRGITVDPFRGQHALRIGTPTGRFAAQPKGDHIVKQTFKAASPDLVLALRLLSWETTGEDSFFVSITDPSNASAQYSVTDARAGGPFSLPLPGSAPATCSATPCLLKVSMRGARPMLDSGWREMKISGLPTDGRDLLIRYGVFTTDAKESSWAYFDEARRPPVARITITPPNGQLEGDFVFFDCTGSSFDEGGELSCRWDITGATIDPRTLVGPYAIFNLPENDPSLLVVLTVSDGTSSASTSSNFAPSGPLAVQNAAPIVNAVNAEVQAGQGVELLCRYLDFGVLDTHTVSLQVGGSLLATTLVSENEQAYSSGVARAHCDAASLSPGTLTGSCTVTDDEGASRSDAFVVNVLAPMPGRGEPANDSSLTAPRLAADWTYSFDLDQPRDVDVVEVRMADGSAPPANSEVEITLEAAADYDLIVLSRAPGLRPFEGQPLKTSPFLNSPFLNSPFLNSPFLNSPFLNSPFLNSPFLNSPFLNSPFLNSPFLNSPFLNSPFLNSPIAFEEVPLSQVAGSPGGSTVAGSDIGLDELGSFDIADLQDETLVVKTFSARLGAAPERALVRVSPQETALFVAVVSHDGSFSAAPYQLTIQASRPVDREALLGANCVAAPLVAPAQATSSLEVLHAGASAPKTIGVIQRQRFQREHGMDDAAFASWLALIAPSLDHPALAMRLISVPSTLFDASDTAPCNVAARNAVASQVKALVQAELAAFPSARSVTILGSQFVIPHYAESDGTDIANERFYGGDAMVREDSPLAASLAGGFNLTDAFYTAPGLPFGGRTLWVEQLPIGRLAKHPTEIAAEVASFAQNNGVLTATHALATGYDFFIDGTAASEQVLRQVAETKVLNNSTWTASDLRCEAFGTPPPGSDAVCRVPELSVTNLHGTHFAGLSANGFRTGNYADFVDTTDVYGQLAGTLTASIGCHTGLDVPASWSIPQAFGLKVDPAFDWAQQAGVQIRPLNYGIGHTDFADRGTEGLLTQVLSRATAGLSLGEALSKAKAGYLLGLRQVDVYDEDSVISLALIGLPQWRLSPTAATPPPGQPPGSPNPATTPFGTLVLTVRELGTTTTLDRAIGRADTARGSYFALGGSSDAPHARAIQGRTAVFSERAVTGTKVHDVALRGGTYTVVTPFDPVIATFTQEWARSQPEPKACVDTMAPTQIGTVNTLDSAGQTLQTLLFTGSQFECTLALADQGVLDVVGDERVWKTATIEALHPNSAAFDADFAPVRVTRQDVVANPSSGDIELTLDATDASGLREVVALVYEDLDNVPGGPGRAVSYSTGNLTGIPGPHALTLPGAYGKLISIQYIDGAGNLLLKSFKGKLFEAIPVQIQTSIFSGIASTSIVVEIGNWAALTTPVLEIDFGDGTSAVLPLTNPNGSPAAFVQLLPNGSAIATITHDYTGFTGNAITVNVHLSALGAGGSDSAVLYNCGDPLGDFENPSGDLVSCGNSVSEGVLSMDVRVAGAPDTSTFVYRVRFPALGTEMFLSGNDVSPAGVSATLLPDGVRFTAPASAIGWNGASVLEFQPETARRSNGNLTDAAGPFTLAP